MTMNVLGYAAHSAKAKLTPNRFERREMRADDVLIEILYCGVCHPDLHHVNNDWGNDTYPMVPGHEIVGRVLSVGAQVNRFKPGDHFGVGYIVDSCRHCAACTLGFEQYCDDHRATYTYNSVDRHDQMRTFGGYSEKIVISEAFVLKVPDGLNLKATAPLLCAGITAWSPLRHWNVGKDSKVAVVGLGGIGHMALKLAKGLGANVTLFTRSPGKEQDARRLGADSVVLSTDAQQMVSVKGKFDVIIDTVPYVHDLNP